MFYDISLNQESYLETQDTLPLQIDIPKIDSSYQFLTINYNVLSDRVVKTGVVGFNKTVYPQLVEARLTNFARERDIDLNEIGLLMNCNNLAWRLEAEKFMNLYTATWTAFYNANANLTDWKQIEAQLPVLTWE